MENDIVKELIENILLENKELFSDNEMRVIKENFNVSKKLYLLGLKNGLDFSKIYNIQ